ncbi:MAG: HEAT repeat domain-containing protein [Actinomycetota bacterium]|nr:HEAT repeat domain-containing protein [Actinomycetota bacterium]
MSVADFAGSGSTRERVEYLLVPSDDPRWRDAARALDPGEALPVLAEALGPGRDARTRRMAVLIVGVIGDKRGIPLLLNVADDTDPVLRARVVEALAAVGPDPGAAQRVVDAAKDESAFVRETAARALAALALPESPALLAQLAADPAPEVRRAVEDAKPGGGS